MDKKYLVKVDDNFHPMDTGEAYDDKTYSSLEEAVKRCKEITIDSLIHCYKKGMSASKLLEQWMAFGDDPFVYTGEGDLPFSARDFVTEELCLYVIKEVEKENKLAKIKKMEVTRDKLSEKIEELRTEINYE